jgi:hypothetical protein
MLVMATRSRFVHGSLAVVVLSLVLGAGSLGGPHPAEAASANLPAWTGGIDLYRRGVFTTQKSWLWCTAAGVQIMRNIADRKADHSTAGQRRYFGWMRDRNRYDLPLSRASTRLGRRPPPLALRMPMPRVPRSGTSRLYG